MRKRIAIAAVTPIIPNGVNLLITRNTAIIGNRIIKQIALNKLKNNG